MKKRLFPIIMAGILVLGVIISSCTKDKNLAFSDNLTQTDNGLLKSFMVKSVTLTPIQQLGKNIFYDKISVPNSMACADCHSPSVGFTGPNVGTNIHGSVYRGADAHNFGNRKPPSAAYATFSPILHQDEGVFVGGNFWDGRATGERLGSPAAEQALGPFLNPAEQNVPDKLTVLQKIAKSKYISMWETVWGTPLSYSSAAEIDLNYDRVGYSIAAYEGSNEVNQFSSKFDYYLKNLVGLTSEEAKGLELFNSKCASCHISESIGEIPPLFTDFTFDNLGVPINPENPVYDYNPAFIDYGLGGFLLTRPDYISMATENMGKQKVPTLRNVDKKPGIGFTKAYTHNGVFKSLKEVVHFYNTRDDGSWPAPEVSANINTVEIGNLGLSDAEENAIVSFMETLSDGYIIK